MTPSGTSPERSRLQPGALPLVGVRVIDLSLARAGPSCVRHFADWGADVIRIEPPDKGDEEAATRRAGSDYRNLHRNKRVLKLDLKSAEGYDIFIQLVKTADVLVENMRVQVKHRLKIAWEDLRDVNPRLVYGSISGFGQTGPYANRPGVDQIAQGMGGMMSMTGTQDGGPMRAGIALSDMSAGDHLTIGLMMALFQRFRTGCGKWVHTSLLESQIFMLDFQAARFLAGGEVPARVGNDHPTDTATGAFPCLDGHANISAYTPGQWEALCQALEQPDWLSRPGWDNQKARRAMRSEIHACIGRVTARWSRQQLIERLEHAGVPCGPVYAIDEVFGDSQVQHLGMAATVDTVDAGESRMVASPINFDEHGKPGIRSVAAKSATDSREILASLAIDDSKYAELLAQGIVE